MEEKKDIYILAIESSCDETAAAVVKNGREVLSNVISSQIDLHTLYGGVVPEIASRKHVENIDGVIKKALADAGMTLEEMDAIGVTYGPGLVGALLVGLAEAKALAYAAGKPLIGVHHIEGHICANYIQNKDFAPPYMALVVSGGHSHLVYVSDYLKARAIENQCFILGVNRSGEGGGLSYIGDSMAVSPTGEVLAHVEGGNGLTIVDIDPNEADAYRKSFPVKADRKPALYHALWEESSKQK